MPQTPTFNPAFSYPVYGAESSDVYPGSVIPFMGAQTVSIDLGGGPVIPTSYVNMYVDYGSGNVLTASEAIVNTGTTVSLWAWPPVFPPDDMTITIDTGTASIGTVTFYLSTDHGYDITNMSGTGLPSFTYPVNGGRIQANSFTGSISSQSVLITVSGSGAGKQLRTGIGAAIYDTTPLSGSGGYSINIPSVSVGQNLNIIIENV